MFEIAKKEKNWVLRTDLETTKKFLPDGTLITSMECSVSDLKDLDALIWQEVINKDA